ncbi:MAG TPA: type III-B CRISPR module-associated protein Cmr5 [Nannocystis exedens]|nr:type III-B CRISPR module-associated protein Cmr5 [Nannocystis exedens]
MSRQNLSPQTVHNERAQWAWTKVSEVQEEGGSLSKDYAIHVRKLPARIKINGLGQALAFLYSKAKDDDNTGAGRLLLDLGERITALLDNRQPGKRIRRKALMERLVDMSPDQYRRTTHELMTTSEWMKRFVDGLFDKETD